MKKHLLLFGVLAGLLFFATVYVLAPGVSGYSHISDTVSEIGQIGSPVQSSYQLAMLIVEVMYQDEISQLPLIASLQRLTPELDLVQRYTFLAISVKRQIVSTISIISFWIAFGGTPQGMPLTMGMVLITVLTAYGMSHLKELARAQQATTNSDTASNQPGEMTNRIMSQ